MKKEIGPLLLSGLMVDPILGSGIVLLPPLAFKTLGNQAIWAWLIMMILGAIFAFIFSKLAILYPGEGGMTNAIEAVYGKRGKVFASLLMIGAVSMGPAAVALTAVEYLYQLPAFNKMSPTMIAVLFVTLGAIVLTRNLQFMSTMSFILSSIIGITLIVSSIKTLMVNAIQPLSLEVIDISTFGSTLQLLFWAIIGWEIVGNYSGQVKNIKRTIPMATAIGVAIVSIIYIGVALAIQSFSINESLSLIDILIPIFGEGSIWVLAILVTALCFCTYVLVVGALSRLLYALASDGYLPKRFARKSQNYGFINGIIYFLGVHIVVLLLNAYGLLNIEKIVNIANGFFLLNAIVGLLAGYRVIENKLLKIGCWILILSFSIILLFSSIECYLAFGVIALLTWRRTPDTQKPSFTN